MFFTANKSFNVAQNELNRLLKLKSEHDANLQKNTQESIRNPVTIPLPLRYFTEGIPRGLPSEMSGEAVVMDASVEGMVDDSNEMGMRTDILDNLSSFL